MPNTTKRPAGKNHPADIQNANNRGKKYIFVISAILLVCAIIGCNGPINNPTRTPTAKGVYAPTARKQMIIQAPLALLLHVNGRNKTFRNL